MKRGLIVLLSLVILNPALRGHAQATQNNATKIVLNALDNPDQHDDYIGAFVDYELDEVITCLLHAASEIGPQPPSIADLGENEREEKFSRYGVDLFMKEALSQLADHLTKLANGRSSPFSDTELYRWITSTSAPSRVCELLREADANNCAHADQGPRGAIEPLSKHLEDQCL